MVPGHCYVIAYSPNTGLPLDEGIPIECTSITPQAVDKTQPVSFDDSVKMAVEETKKHLEDGRIQVLPVAQYEQLGFTPPELPDVDVTKITETLEKRLTPRGPQPVSRSRSKTPLPSRTLPGTSHNSRRRPSKPCLPSNPAREPSTGFTRAVIFPLISLQLYFCQTREKSRECPPGS